MSQDSAIQLTESQVLTLRLFNPDDAFRDWSAWSQEDDDYLTSLGLLSAWREGRGYDITDAGVAYLAKIDGAP